MIGSLISTRIHLQTSRLDRLVSGWLRYLTDGEP